MKLIKVAGAELNQTPLDWDGNQARIIEAISRAKAEQATILCLPELCIPGYGCEDMFFSPGVVRTSLESLFELLPHTRGMIALIGLPIMYQNRTFNGAALAVDGKLEGIVAKRFLAGSGIHYEPRWFTPWPAEKRVEIELHVKGQALKVPFGDIFFNIAGVKMGFEICEDAWVANRPGRELYRHGMDIILNPSASHFAFEKFEIRKRFVLEGSRAFGVAYVYANLLGNESGRAIYDGGVIIASSGHLTAISDRLTFHDVRVTSAVIDIDEARMAQSQAATSFNIPELVDRNIAVDFSFPNIRPETANREDMPWESSPHLQEEEFARAVSLALFDYMRKSRSRGFVVSLSGGADSSAIVCLVWLMVKLGIASIGLEAFKRKLAYISELTDCQTADQIVRRLLTTAYQPTENSGPITRNAAQELAKAVNAHHLEFDVNGVFKEYVKVVSEGLGREINWETDDIALQNIQARVRAPSVWMMANIKNALLVSTSNRSEAAVGYATMDGDTSGGISPIAGIDKAFLRQWLRWLETKGVDNELHIPALRWVNEQQPTAELRPQAAKQTDEADLMPYDLLDAVEEAAIRDKKLPHECLAMLQMQFPQYNDEQLREWIARFFRLWCRNQWKRERYAPSFHLDDKNLDPKTWCRFPILSGGFERELREL